MDKTLQDIDYLQELMEDFPVSSALSVHQAQDLLLQRYQRLEIQVEELGHTFSQMLARGQFIFTPHFHLQTHHYLYADILKNAGMYRQEIDKNGGKVMFGNLVANRFEGVHPSHIEADMNEVCHLLSATDDPIRRAAEYYQKFVYIHPFYDANGRIGRFVATIYLNMCGYHLYWQQLQRNKKWFKKQNSCHKRMGTVAYGQYLAYWVNYWAKHMVTKETIMGDLTKDNPSDNG